MFYSVTQTTTKLRYKTYNSEYMANSLLGIERFVFVLGFFFLALCQGRLGAWEVYLLAPQLEAVYGILLKPTHQKIGFDIQNIVSQKGFAYRPLYYK